jgi:hypothetical protein
MGSSRVLIRLQTVRIQIIHDNRQGNCSTIWSCDSVESGGPTGAGRFTGSGGEHRLESGDEQSDMVARNFRSQ